MGNETWEIVKKTMYFYFKFAYYAFLPALIGYLLLAYYEVYVKEGCYYQRYEEMKRKEEK